MSNDDLDLWCSTDTRNSDMLVVEESVCSEYNNELERLFQSVSCAKRMHSVIVRLRLSFPLPNSLEWTIHHIDLIGMVGTSEQLHWWQQGWKQEDTTDALKTSSCDSRMPIDKTLDRTQSELQCRWELCVDTSELFFLRWFLVGFLCEMILAFLRHWCFYWSSCNMVESTIHWSSLFSVFFVVEIVAKRLLLMVHFEFFSLRVVWKSSEFDLFLVFPTSRNHCPESGVLNEYSIYWLKQFFQKEWISVWSD